MGVSVAVFVTVRVTELDTVELPEAVEVPVTEFVPEADTVVEKVTVGDVLEVDDTHVVAVMMTDHVEEVVDVIELDNVAEPVDDAVIGADTDGNC